MNGSTVLPIPTAFVSRWVLVGIAALVTIFDACFYDRKSFPGFSLAIFFASAALMIRLKRSRTQTGGRGGTLLLLIAGCVLDHGHWREFSLRAWINREALASGGEKK